MLLIINIVRGMSRIYLKGARKNVGVEMKNKEEGWGGEKEKKGKISYKRGRASN